MKPTRKFWDAEELERAHALKAAGFGYEQIGAALGRTTGSVVTAIQKRLVNPHAYASGIGRGDQVLLKPDERLLAARDARAAASEARTITATLMGDPPPGYSALDRKGA